MNRHQVIHLNYLCTRPNDDLLPSIFVNMVFKGARLQYRQLANVVWGAPAPAAILRGLLVTLAAIVLSALYLSNPWTIAVVCALVGLFAQMPGALLWRGERWLRRLVAG